MLRGSAQAPSSKRTARSANTSSNPRTSIQFLLNEPSSGTTSSRSTAGYQCDECHKWFTQRADVRERDFRCDECGLAFGERGNLNKHIRSVHRKERNFACTECPAAFSFRNGLSEHIRMKHSDDRPFGCSTCKAAFKKKSHLVRHRELIHSNSGGSSSR